MARFWIMSDLHQEDADNAWTPREPSEPYDAIVVAGDAHVPLTRALPMLRGWWPDREIVYVPGNHDFWQWPGTDGQRLTMDQILERGHEGARDLDIRLLTDASTAIAGTRILGCTLWTDYRVEGLHTLRGAMHAAERGMNDYRRIRRASSSRPTKPIRPIDLLVRHQASVAFLDAELAVPHDGPTLVVTHHAPHPRSLFSRMDSLNVCYASDLTWLIERHAPQAWIHGHVHVPSDYVVDRTRILANPRGYSGEIQSRRWRQDLVIEA